jgi:hypothetical protein
MFAMISPTFFKKDRLLVGVTKETNPESIVVLVGLSNTLNEELSTIFFRKRTAASDDIDSSPEDIESSRLLAKVAGDDEKISEIFNSDSLRVVLSGFKTPESRIEKSDITAIFIGEIWRKEGKLDWALEMKMVEGN